MAKSSSSPAWTGTLCFLPKPPSFQAQRQDLGGTTISVGVVTAQGDLKGVLQAPQPLPARPLPLTPRLAPLGSVSMDPWTGEPRTEPLGEDHTPAVIVCRIRSFVEAFSLCARIAFFFFFCDLQFLTFCDVLRQRILYIYISK